MAKASGVQELILEALQRALADPTPRKLHGTKANPGIFLSASAAAKAAASQCIDQGLVRQVGQAGTRTRPTPLYRITPAGAALALEQSPAPRLLVAMLDATDRTAKTVAQCERTLVEVSQHVAELRGVCEQVASRLQPPDLAKIMSHVSNSDAHPVSLAGDRTADLDEDLIRFVRARKVKTPLQPVELPDMFRHAAAKVASLSIGQFHDSVRRLAGQDYLRLLPYTQAMYQLAEPEYALIIGREVMYYAEPVTNSTR